MFILNLLYNVVVAAKFTACVATDSINSCEPEWRF